VLLTILTVFDNAAAKFVTATDMSRLAYVLTMRQVGALRAAGRPPAHDDPFHINILFDPDRFGAEASYYESTRGRDAKRSPEPRMGREVVSQWMSQGDSIVIANIGVAVFAFKQSAAPTEVEDVVAAVAHYVPDVVFDRATKTTKAPARKVVQRNVYVRDPWVVAAALLRADGFCEMPKCEIALFLRDDGRPYLEVHHIDPLSNGGLDVLENVAALCPRCHRLLHHGQKRAEVAGALAETVRSKG